MEQTNKNYPKFEAGQVLTSQALNSYFGYLDEQERLTRAQLLGVGIISGLEYECYGSQVIIKKGTAVTADGYLIDLPEDTTYQRIYKYNKNGNMLAKQIPLSSTVDKDFEKVLNNVEYVYYKDESDATKHNLNPTSNTSLPNDWKTNFVLALMVDFVSQDSITQCSELSCDIVQSNFEIEIRPVLIKKELLVDKTLISQNARLYYDAIDLEKQLRDGIFHPTKKQSFVLSGQNYNDFLQGIIYWLIGVNQDGWTNQNLLKNINYKLIGKKALFLKLFNNINEDRFDSLLTHIKSFKNLKSTIPSYYLQHLLNIETALEEFIDYYDKFVDKYNFIPISDTTTFKRIVFLGLGQYSLENEYRQYNNNILRNPQFKADRSLVEKALNRIFLLAESFNRDYTSNYSIISKASSICTFLKPNAKLGEMKKPDYYGQQLTKDDWSFDSISGNWNSIYDDFDLFNSNGSLVVENYYGMKKLGLETLIGSFISQHNLPITIESIPIGSINDIIKKYKDDYSRDGLLEVLRTFNDLAKFSTCMHFYNDQSETKLANNWADVLYIINAKKEFGSEAARKSLDMIRKILKEYESLDDNSIILKFFHDLYHSSKDKNSAFNREKWTEMGRKVIDHLYNTIHDNKSIIYTSLSDGGYINKNLRYCIEYLSYYAQCSPIQINGCPCYGKLTIFYTNDENEKVILIVGSGEKD